MTLEPCRLSECGNMTRSRRGAGYCSDTCREIARDQVRLVIEPPDGTRPTEHGRLLTRYDVDDHRRLDCRRYSECLGYAARMCWSGFTCRKCPVSDQISPEEKFHQLAGSLRLRAAVDAQEAS